MSEVKPQITKDDVLALLQSHFAGPVSEVAPIASGQIRMAYSFMAGGVGYVVRFGQGSAATTFRKEEYIYRHYSTPLVPIPAVVQIGEWGEFSYAVTVKAPGNIMHHTMPPDEYARAYPSLIETLAAIGRTDVSATSGYGHFDDDGVGRAASWREHILAIIEDEEGGFYDKWQAMFDEGPLERDVVMSVYDRLQKLVKYCPEERHLVHGDFGNDNVLVRDGRITAVIDWANSRYGDPLYDVAWLDFWPPYLDFKGRYRSYCAERGIEHPNYERRILCYQCYNGLDALRFFAKTDPPGVYAWARDHILAILDKGSHL